MCMRAQHSGSAPLRDTENSENARVNSVAL